MEFNRFDVSTKELVWDDPVAWLRRLGVEPRGPVEVIDSDITALTASADKVIRVDDPEPFLVNIELQSSYDSGLVRTLWFRQVALDYRHDLPVLTILVLLRKEANSPSLTGDYERTLPGGRPTNRYNYQVVRLWEEPVDSFLDGGVELVPLAPLADVQRPELAGLIRRMADRINALDHAQAAKLWTASYLLMGLRYPDELTDRLFEGVQVVRDSSTYQKILRDGRSEGVAEGLATEARRLLLRYGTKHLGEPGPATLAALEEIHEVDRLETLLDSIFNAEVGDWAGLLGLA